MDEHLSWMDAPLWAPYPAGMLAPVLTPAVVTAGTGGKRDHDRSTASRRQYRGIQETLEAPTAHRDHPPPTVPADEVGRP
ncbi:hypothetical protein [Actinacidiphila oryziradicis]|uniref:Uncharacterized protein n=1 Tax=Actinacidiphila oryziradicis TaxID=2571141 RepID=A0A4U0S4F8_9ACTN|nr:hypothetical protein [Actinacidiphila oryziradicis]TKA01941.1 hypothetical protein FCI23_39840 [Actinacidiphila oryziradicis]